MLAHLPTADNYINGEWIAGSGTAESINPADGSVLGHYGTGRAGPPRLGCGQRCCSNSPTGWRPPATRSPT